MDSELEKKISKSVPYQPLCWALGKRRNLSNCKLLLTFWRLFFKALLLTYCPLCLPYRYLYWLSIHKGSSHSLFPTSKPPLVRFLISFTNELSAYRRIGDLIDCKLHTFRKINSIKNTISPSLYMQMFYKWVHHAFHHNQESCSNIIFCIENFY